MLWHARWPRHQPFLREGDVPSSLASEEQCQHSYKSPSLRPRSVAFIICFDAIFIYVLTLLRRLSNDSLRRSGPLTFADAASRRPLPFAFHTSQGAIPLPHIFSNCCLSLKVSMPAQKPS